MATVTICSDFGAQENKICHCFYFPPFICHEVMGPDPMIFVFWMLSFKPAFSALLFTFIRRLFSFSLLYGISGITTYLELLIFLLAILITSSDSSRLALCVMYSTCKLNKQGDNIQPWRTSFPILNQSIFLCLDLTVASWPAYRFLRRLVRWSGIPISLRILSKNFPHFVVIHTVKGWCSH